MLRSIAYITKGVETNQPRFIQKAIRQNAIIRKNINRIQIEYIIKKYIPSQHPLRNVILKSVEKIPVNNDDLMEVETTTATTTTSVVPAASTTVPPATFDTTKPVTPAVIVTDEDIKRITTSMPSATLLIPEVEVYIYLVIIVTMLRYAGKNNNSVAYSDIVESVNEIIDYIRSYNRRSLDQLNSKIYFYLSFCYEKISKLENIRPVILALYRTACIRHDEMSQAVLLNLILRNYLHYNLVEQAHTFSLRTTFPENVSNNQYCRYLYYMGRIQAIQLEYTGKYL